MRRVIARVRLLDVIAVGGLAVAMLAGVSVLVVRDSAWMWSGAFPVEGVGPWTAVLVTFVTGGEIALLGGLLVWTVFRPFWVSGEDGG